MSLSGEWLNKCHEKVNKAIDAGSLIPNAIAYLTLDSWTNVTSDPVVNYASSVANCSVFLESVSTGEQGYTSK